MPRVNLRRCFKGVQPGEQCTGTVHFWGLSSKRLLHTKVIRETQNGRDYVLVGVPKKGKR